jgi:hypothetical protein
MSDKGFKNLIWFMGIVEDNNDPQKLGRVKVRCFGFHTEDKTLLPTDDLPWAYIISGNFSAAITIPQLNSWAWGFFLDGKYAQQPMLTGTMLGMPTVPTFPSDGYSAEAGVILPCDLFQPDISRLARNENIEQTNVVVKDITRATGIEGANGQGWSQPESSYAAQYPYNYVHETKAGHVFELDDTPGAERVHLYHTSGSFVEMDAVGTMVIKSGRNMYMVIEADGNISIDGDYSVTAAGSISMYAKNDMTLQVDGNLKTNIHGNYELNVAGYMNTNVGEAIRTRGLKMAIESQEELDIYAGSELRLGSQIISAKSSGDIFFNAVSGNLELKAGVNANIYGAADANMRSDGKVNLQSGTINVNASGTVNVDNLVNMANGAAGNAAISAGGTDVNRTELLASDVPERKSPIKKTNIPLESPGMSAVDDTAESGPQ